MLLKIKKSLHTTIHSNKSLRLKTPSQSELEALSQEAYKAAKKKPHLKHGTNFSSNRHYCFTATIKKVGSPIKTTFSDTKEGKKLLVKNFPISLEKDGIEIQTSNIVDKNLIKSINELKGESLLEVHGVFIDVVKDNFNSIPIFVILKITQISSYTKLIKCPKKIRKKALRIMKKGKVFLFIRNTLIEILQIKGLNNTPMLSMAIDFAILQAVSGGMFENSSGKLHSFLIGAPASGKKLVSEVVKILNPIHESASSGKLTVAGISAATTAKDGVWTSSPGALIKAHNGALTCQDYHNTTKSIQNQLMGIFAEVMENAFFKDTTLANQTYKACTAIHIDSNRQSDIFKNFEGNSQENIYGLPINILSRFDSIIVIEGNAKQQLDISLKIIEGSESISNKTQKIQLLKFIIATLKDDYETITITKKTRTQLQRYHQELFSNQENIEAVDNDIASFMTRTGISALKITKAITCLRQRKNSKPIYAKETYKYIQNKFMFINSIIPNSCKTSKLNGRSPSTSELLRWMKKKWKDNEFTINEVTKQYQKDFVTNQTYDAAKRSIYRKTEDYLIKKKGHYYTLLE